MTVVFAKLAQRELDRHLELLRKESPALAAERLRDVLERIDALSARTYPEGVAVTLRTGRSVRQSYVHPLKIYYERQPNDVLRIVRILHHARKPITR